MMPPRKAAEPTELEPTEDPQPAPKPVDSPPGPLFLDVRVGPAAMMTGKIVCSQRIHDYTIDQHDDKVIITGILRQP